MDIYCVFAPKEYIILQNSLHHAEVISDVDSNVTPFRHGREVFLSTFFQGGAALVRFGLGLRAGNWDRDMIEYETHFVNHADGEEAWTTLYQ